MTLEYLSGNRIQALSSDTKPTNPQAYATWEETDTEKTYTYYADTPAWKKLGNPSIGGWKELGRTTASGGETSITVNVTNKRYYMVLVNIIPQTSTLGTGIRFNADTANNYAFRESDDGSADVTHVSFTNINTYTSSQSTPDFQVYYIANYSTKEKLLYGGLVQQSTAGAGTAPLRIETVGKWVNTTTEIQSVNIFRSSGTGTFASGSEVVVLGYDPADTHTTNFWAELASVTLGVAGDTIDSSTITAKKYLWVQIYQKASGSTNGLLRFNGDTANNYASRGSSNGGADSTTINTSGAIGNYGSAVTTSAFHNFFIVNVSANEKLVISSFIGQNTAGAGTAPTRQEVVGKWITTGSQITSIQFTNTDTGNYDVGSIIKVWGAN